MARLPGQDEPLTSAWALATNPNNGDAYLVIGTAHQAANRNGEARTAYKKYLELRPSGPHASDVRAILKQLD